MVGHNWVEMAIRFWHLRGREPWGGLRDHSLWREVTHKDGNKTVTTYVHDPDGNSTAHEYMPTGGALEVSSTVAGWLESAGVSLEDVRARMEDGELWVPRVDVLRSLNTGPLGAQVRRQPYQRDFLIPRGSDLFRAFRVIKHGQRAVLELVPTKTVLHLNNPAGARPWTIGSVGGPTSAQQKKEAFVTMVAEHGILVLWGDVPNGSLPRVGSP